jgi:asparagine synthase (glutamine-hydrolysing)
MPGLCAILHPPHDSSRSLLDSMTRRMTPFDWFRQSVQIRPEEGVAIGAVTFQASPEAVTATEDGRFALALDGELYEADALREGLRRAGAPTGPDTDAALLLHGWLHERDAFLARLHGSFNALIWDREARELTVVTDRFGQRPIYVARTGDSVLVASEIKALLVHPGLDRTRSEAGLGQFFAFGHFFNDDTFYAAVRAVPMATTIAFRAPEMTARESSYWQPRPSAGSSADADLTQALDAHLVAAVARRARPGERLGLSLSGGLDARTLLGLMPAGLNLTSVSIGIDGSIDHRGASELARLAGVPHHKYLLDSAFLSHFEEHLRAMIRLTDGHYLDQGIVMPTMPTYRTLGIDYLLRGHGGELLHMTKAYAYSLDEGVLDASESVLESWLFTHLTAYMLDGVPSEVFAVAVRDEARAALSAALARTTPGRAPIDRVWQLFLSQRLHRETALSMHMFGCFSAVRMPYVDNDVVDTLLAMPARLKLRDELQTSLLQHHRPAFLDVVNSNTGARMGAGRLEGEIARFRMRVGAKLGLKGYQPYERLGLWLRQELRPMVERVLLDERCLARGVFVADVVRRVVREHMARQKNHTFLLMSLLIFELGQQMLDDPDGF